jgi:lysophospholipase L1-like esterase
MTHRASIRHRWSHPYAVMAVCVLAIQCVAWSALIVTRSNTVERNVQWRTMKKDVIYHVTAFEDFLKTPIRSGINLWLGQGYGGILWERPLGFTITRVEADLRLDTPGSYAYILFRNGRDGCYGVLLSRAAAYRSGFYVFTREWEATAYSAVSAEALGEKVHVELALRGDQFDLAINGRHAGRFRHDRYRDGTAGFKSGFYPVHIESVTFHGLDAAGQSREWSDSFQHGSWSGAPLVGVLIGLGLFVAVRPFLFQSDRGRAAPAFACASSGIFSIVQLGTASAEAGAISLLLLFATLSLQRMPAGATAGLSRRAVGGAATVICALSVTHDGRPQAAPLATQAQRTSIERPALELGSAVPLGAGPMANQVLTARIRLHPGSIVEVRFWSDEPPPVRDYRCYFSSYAFVLSTAASIESGFYRLDEGVTRLVSARVPAEGWLNLRIVIEDTVLRAYHDGTLLARTRVPEAGHGRSGVFLFAGAAEIERATAEAGSATHPAGAWSLPRGSYSLGAVFIASAVLLMAVRRMSPVSALQRSAAPLGLGAMFIGIAAVLRLHLPLGDMETRFLIWCGLTTQVSGLLRPLLGRVNWPSVALVAALMGASFVATSFARWSGPFRVVQAELQPAMPPTPASWLWYRHPSFRACNQFLLTQRFAGRLVTRSKPASTRRVIAIGASQTLGFGSTDYDHTYPAALQRMLDATAPGYEVVNAGVPGSFTVTARGYFNGVLRQFDPDVVVINFCAADYLYYSLLRLQGIDPASRLSTIERVGFKPNLFARIVDGARSRYGYYQLQRYGPGDIDWVVASYARNLESLVGSVKDAGAVPLVMLEPKTPEVSNPIIDYTRLYQTVRTIGARTGTSVIDPGWALAEAEESGIVWWDYAHLTDYGYRRLAGEVAHAIRGVEALSAVRQ